MSKWLWGIFLLTTFLVADEQPPVFLPIESTEDFYSGSNIILEIHATDESSIENILLYYRFSKEDPFTSVIMEKEMFYVGEIPESEVRPGKLEYYFFARDKFGNQSTWPENGEDSPESYPVFEPLFSGVSHGDILIDLLNPLADEVSEEASIIILSLYDPEESLNLDDIRLFIDDEDVSEFIFRSTDMLTYVPHNSLNPGKHIIGVKLVDDGGEYLSKKFKFTLAEINLSAIEKVDFRKKFKFKGNISYNSDFDEFFGKDRPENRPLDSHKLNVSAKFTIGDFKVKSSVLMNTHLIDETARLVLDRRQPSNRLKLGISSPYIDFKYGDFSTEFSDFTLKGTRVRGIYSRLKLGPWKTSIVSGYTKEIINFENETGYDPGYGVWAAEEAEAFIDEPNGSYEKDIDEFIINEHDENENGEWDEGEDYIDIGNGVYDVGEIYVDSNQNGQWDFEEVLTDSNGNELWDDAEIYSDLNGNGQWDEGEDFTDCGIDYDGELICEGDENWDDSLGNDKWDAAETFDDNPSTVDGTPVSDFLGVSHVIHTKGTASRKMSAFRSELDFSKFNFGISALKSFDEIENYNLVYDELYDKYTFLGNAVIGMDFTIRLNNKKTQFKGETAISLMNDLRGSSIDELAESIGMEDDELNSTKELFSSIEDVVGFNINSDLIIGSSEGRGISIPLPTMDSLSTNSDVIAYIVNSVFKQGTYRFTFQTPIEFEENSFDIKAEYKRVPANFISLGNSSIQTDIQGLKSSIKGRLFKNIISVSLGYNNEHDNLMGETPEEKLKSSTSTSITTSGGFGITYPEYPSLNYSIRIMNREGLSVKENGIWDEGEEFIDGNGIWDEGEELDDLNENFIWDEGESFTDLLNGVYDESESFTDIKKRTVSNKTITHTISPSFKFDTENDVSVSLGGNIMLMNYNDNLFDVTDLNATNANFTTSSYTGSLGLRFDSPLSFNMGGGLSINSPADATLQSTQFLVLSSKLGYKFMEKTLSTFLGLNVVSGNKESDVTGVGGIDNLKMTLKAGAQYKFAKNMSVSLNVDLVSLSDNITPENDFSELKGKLKFKMSF